MWSLLLLSAFASPKKDLSAALKALDANDSETAIRLLDSVLRGGLKPPQQVQAHAARIEVVALHPDPAEQLRLLDRAHASYAALGQLDPDGLWAYKLREETPIIAALTLQAAELATNGNPSVCAELVPYRNPMSPVLILTSAMQCAVAMEDVSAASGITRELLDASQRQENLEPAAILPIITGARLVIDGSSDSMLARLDTVDAELDAIKHRIEAHKSELGDAYAPALQDLADVHLSSVSQRLSITLDMPDSLPAQKELLQEFLDLDPSHITATVQLGQVLLELGEEEAGLSRLDKALALDPSTLNAPYLKGTYWYNKAVPLVNEAAALPPRAPRVREIDAEVKSLMEQSRDAFYAALEIQPDHKGVLDGLEQTCTLLKDRACLKRLSSQ